MSSVKLVVVCMVVTVLIVVYIFIVYCLVNGKAFYSKNFNILLPMVAVIVVAIIRAIQSSIVISLGMVDVLHHALQNYGKGFDEPGISVLVGQWWII